jgi:hypothetical protein
MVQGSHTTVLKVKECMYIENVTFDRVFDVSPSSGDFSFTSAGKTEYGVRFRRRVVPTKGSMFAVAFAEIGNWNTVLGWRDLTSTEVILMRPTWFQLSNLINMLLYGPFLIVPLTLLAGITGFVVAVAAIVAAASYCVYREEQNNNEVRQQLFAPAR